MAYNSFAQSVSTTAKATIDLTNVPAESITVTLSHQDAKLKEILTRRIERHRESRDRYAMKKYYALAGKLDVKIAALQEVLDEFNA